MLTTSRLDDTSVCSKFSTKAGCDEFFIVIRTKEGFAFPDALNELTSSYVRALSSTGLSDSTSVFTRLFVSDILSQKNVIDESPLFKRLKTGALSIIEQKPLSCGPIALLSYHISVPNGRLMNKQVQHMVNDSRNSIVLQGTHYSLLMTANYTGEGPFDAYPQTTSAFESLNALMKQQGMNFPDNGIRTWVFVRDIDNHYQTMVKARKELFAHYGLTEKTRYLASTGIMGDSRDPEKIVSLDSMSIKGLVSDQIVRMEALKYLSATILYGVTFERGLRVRFGDRSHLHISGTASIDNTGTVLHIGDAARQAERSIDNVAALLAEHGAALKDLAYAIVYVRNFHDRQAVETVLKNRLSENTPLVFAQAAVCRPTWLVEIEGIAIIPDSTAYPPYL